MNADLDLRGLSRELHRGYDWTARNWRRLAADQGLPAPFIGGARGARPWWDGAAVAAWKAGRTGGGGGRWFVQPQDPETGAKTPFRPPPANDPENNFARPTDRAAQLLAAAGGA